MSKETISPTKSNQYKNTKNFLDTVKEFKERTNGGFDFYDFVMRQYGWVLKRNNNFRLRCPFYEDSNPSMCINQVDGEYLFHDFGDEAFKGDVITFAGYFYDLDPKKELPEILKRAYSDLNLLSNDTKSEKKNNNLVEPLSQVPTIVTVDTNEEKTSNQKKEQIIYRDWDEKDLAYWSQYGILRGVLDEYNVKPINQIIRDNQKEEKSYGLERKIFGYIVDKDDVKIYEPNNKVYKFHWVGKKPANFIFGYAQLPDAGEKVFVTAGEKDVMSLASHGFNAITLNSETANLPEWLLNELTSRFKYIIVLYDIDETGQKNSEKISREHGLINLMLPTEMTAIGKDISDCFKEFESDTNSTIFNNRIFKDIIDNAIENYQSIVNKYSVRSANQRIEDSRNQPDIKMILGPIWGTGELHLLFADTGIGKSAFAIQISDKVSKGEPIFPFLENENPPMRVLVYDFELSDKQFAKRYTDYLGTAYKFNPNLYVDYIDLEELFKNNNEIEYEKNLFKRIEEDVNKINPDMVVVDNITYLASHTTSDLLTAQMVMRRLSVLKKKREISILVISHTIKTKPWMPISLNDMSGAKILSNFADSISAIGRSAKDADIRYIKQLKARNSEMLFHGENVINCSISKNNNFLGLEFIEFGKEREHLTRKGENVIPPKLPEVSILLSEGKTYREIQQILGVSPGAISKWRQKFPDYFVSVSNVSTEGSLGNMETGKRAIN